MLRASFFVLKRWIICEQQHQAHVAHSRGRSIEIYCITFRPVDFVRDPNSPASLWCSMLMEESSLSLIISPLVSALISRPTDFRSTPLSSSKMQWPAERSTQKNEKRGQQHVTCCCCCASSKIRYLVVGWLLRRRRRSGDKIKCYKLHLLSRSHLNLKASANRREHEDSTRNSGPISGRRVDAGQPMHLPARLWAIECNASWPTRRSAQLVSWLVTFALRVLVRLCVLESPR